MMEFVETAVFTGQVTRILRDGEYRELQEHLIGNPTAGSLLQRTGGARKIRWGYEGSGKRGGIRVIYFWSGKRQKFYMLYMFTKNQQSTLTRAQEKALKTVIGELS